MGVSVGPNLVSSNLTLSYDMSNTVKSWKGSPTTNLCNFNIASSGFSSDTPANLSQTADDYTVTYEGRPSRRMNILGAGYCNYYIYNYNTGVSSGVFAASCKIKVFDESNPSAFISGGYIYGSAGSFFPTPTFTALSDGWYQVSWVYSGSAMTLNSLTGLNGTASRALTFYITDYQVEALSFSTPYVANGTSRSNTQAIIDMVDRRTITATSVTYNNDNTFTFTKASGNYLTMPLLSSGNTSVSVSCWAYVTLGTAGCIFVSGSGSGFGIGIGNNYYIASDPGNNVVGLFPAIRWISTGVSYSTTGWKNVVVTMDASAIPSIYLNGTLVGTYSGSAPLTPSTNSYIGRNIGDEGSATDRAFEGRIAHVTFYNKILTATEIKQNFEALRVRYGV